MSFLRGAAAGRDARSWALQARDAARLRAYREYLDAYEGRHWSSTSRRGSRSQLTVNYCRAIVDKGVSYLLGRGIGLAVEPEGGKRPLNAAATEALLYRVYDEADLAVVDLAAAQNAGILGDAVQKVRWDPVSRTIRVYSIDPLGWFPSFSGDDSGELVGVDQCYQISSAEAQRLYGRSSARDLTEIRETWTAERFELWVDGVSRGAGANPYEFLPFVHIANLVAPNESYGRSDLVDVLALNRSYNERLSDQADLIRYHADPPVVFTGVNEHTDLAVGPGTVWDLPADADVKLLEWQGTAPAVEDHLDRLLRAIYEVAETPRTSFGDSGRLLSGVALETELRPLIQRTLRKRVIWTAALRRRNAMILKLAERFELDGARPGDFAPYRSSIIWPPMVPRDDSADVANQVSLVGAGIRSRRSAMDALGVQDPEAELAKVVADRAELGESGDARVTGQVGFRPADPAGRPPTTPGPAAG